MKWIFLTLFVLALGVLACGQYVTPTPTAPAVTPSARVGKMDTPTPSPTAEATLDVLIPAGPETAMVVAAAVNVRAEPGGVETGKYVYAGQSVVVLEFSPDGKWARIQAPAGWVYLGCISLTMESGLGCETKE